MAPAAETYQNCLSICQVEGGLEGSEEAGRDDVFVDKVGEAHHAVFPSCTTGSVRTEATPRHTVTCLESHPTAPPVWTG